MHDLVVVGGLERSEGSADVLLFAFVGELGGDVERFVGGRVGGGRFVRGGSGLGQGGWGGGRAALVDDEVADVFVDGGAEIAGDDFVHVAVPDGDAVKVMQWALGAGGRETSGDAEPIFRCYRRGRERPDVEEHDNRRGRLEFLQEVDEDGWCPIRAPRFIEEDANASESADECTAHTGPEVQDSRATVFLSVRGEIGQQLAWGNPVLPFGMPLVLLPIAPEDENARQEDGETKGKPSAIGYFRESG